MKVKVTFRNENGQAIGCWEQQDQYLPVYGDLIVLRGKPYRVIGKDSATCFKVMPA